MYWIWTLFYVIFHQHAGRTEKLMKRSNIVRKQARRRCWNKAGCWRVNISVHSLSCESQADVMLSVGKLHSARLFQIDSDLVLSDATPARQTTSSNRMKNMSSADKLFYILSKEIMLIINIDRADLQYRWKNLSIRPIKNLSLIHIWRCRRLLTCRSRWSPYH